MNEHILLVEDEKNLQNIIRSVLSEEGYQVETAFNCEQASPKIKQSDLVILDWMLPDGQGIELLKRWRQQGIDTPVIFLTARNETIDKVLGLELGANDYMTKPFESRELLARIRVQLRSQKNVEPEASSLKVGGVQMDLKTRAVWYEDKAIELTRMEFELLKFFLERPDEVFSREQVLDLVWGYEAFPTTRTVDTHVLQLRQKTCPSLIETIRGVGYRLQKTHKQLSPH